MKCLSTILFFFISTNLAAQVKLEELANCQIDSLNGEYVHLTVDKPPKYMGDYESLYTTLSKNIKYNSEELKRIGFPASKIYISMIIDKESKIQNFCISSNSIDFNQSEIIEKISNWEAGTHNGKNVHVRVVIPLQICFRLY